MGETRLSNESESSSGSTGTGSTGSGSTGSGSTGSGSTSSGSTGKTNSPDLGFAFAVRCLADSLANGEWSEAAIQRLIEDRSQKKARWMADLAREMVEHLGQNRPTYDVILGCLRDSRLLRKSYRKARRLGIVQLGESKAVMSPASGAPKTWRVPTIRTAKELAEWLAIPLESLIRFSDLRRAVWSVASSRDYVVRLAEKRSGGLRIIESPKPRLKKVQRDILHGILSRIPPHEAAHGFREGHNIKTYVSGHTGKPFVLKLDLRHFFPAVRRARVSAIFRTAGYPENVVKLLSNLTTTVTPPNAWPDAMHESRLAALCKAPHLPQGAPTSPALANLAAYRLDCRLAGLAEQFGARYSRYADDLLFSGGADLAKRAKRFHVFAMSIILEENFEINPRKTRFMRHSARQRAAGLVINEFANTPRDDFDRLKAILHNAKVHGIESQNRDQHPNFRAHLLGRIQFHASINCQRGERLMRLFKLAFAEEE